jgi:hypothetical protein
MFIKFFKSENSHPKLVICIIASSLWEEFNSSIGDYFVSQQFQAETTEVNNEKANKELAIRSPSTPLRTINLYLPTGRLN